MDIKSLTKKFSSKGSLEFRQQGDGLILLDIQNQYAHATVCLQGAQLLSWRPLGSTPVIWLSEQAVYQQQKSIRGGVPVCWPWFGAHKDDPNMPAHGFARTQEWDLAEVNSHEDGSTDLLLTLEGNKDVTPLWPYAFTLSLQMHIGAALEMSLTTHNRDKQAMVISEALHTYFQVSDINKVSVDGLDQCSYLDKVDGFNEKIQTGPLRIDTEVDRIYSDTTDVCVINDTGLNRQIVVSKSGSHSTVVWNPWAAKSAAMSDMGEQAYTKMLCVESANAAANSLQLAPGESHSLQVCYHVIEL